MGHELADIIQIEPGALTASEAKHVLDFRDADALRDRIAKAGRERQSGLDAGVFKEVGQPEVGIEAEGDVETSAGSGEQASGVDTSRALEREQRAGEGYQRIRIRDGSPTPRDATITHLRSENELDGATPPLKQKEQRDKQRVSQGPYAPYRESMAESRVYKSLRGDAASRNVTVNTDFSVGANDVAPRSVIKTFVEENASPVWVESSVTATTSGTTIDFSSLPVHAP